MTDTADNDILYASYANPRFRDRCRLRFINAAIAATTEVLSLTANGVTAAANNTLHFASTTGVTVGAGVSDLFGSAIIPAGTIVESLTATTVIINNNAAGAGVAIGDVINFAPVAHVQRLAFAGAIFAGNIDLEMLAMAVLANATNRTNCLANPNVPGGNILDSDIDFQVNSIFTGVAVSRNW